MTFPDMGEDYSKLLRFHRWEGDGVSGTTLGIYGGLLLSRDLKPILASPVLEGVFFRSLHSSTVVVEMKDGAGECFLLSKIKGKPVGVLVG